MLLPHRNAQGQPCNCTFVKHLAWDHQRVTKTAADPHSLVWEPGWPGKGIYHNGELTTWGTNSNYSHMGWPHHQQMWPTRYPGKEWPGLNDPNTLFINIDPEGQVREAHEFQGEWPEEMYQIEPKFKRYGESEDGWSANEFM